MPYRPLYTISGVRQRRPGDWSELFARTTRQLRSLVATRRGFAPRLRRDLPASDTHSHQATRPIVRALSQPVRGQTKSDAYLGNLPPSASGGNIGQRP